MKGPQYVNLSNSAKSENYEDFEIFIFQGILNYIIKSLKMYT